MRASIDSIISSTGLTFPEARERLEISLEHVVHYFQAIHSNQNSLMKVFVDQKFRLWFVFSIFILLIYLISLLCNSIEAYQPGLLFTIIIYLFLFFINFFCFLQSHRINQMELSTLIQNIILQYQIYLKQQQGKLIESPSQQQSFQAIQIPSGHSQVSIVNVYRHHQWMKIPMLLLAEGDIIALMGGDITPCRVYELKVVNVNATTATPGAPPTASSNKKSEAELKWMKTKLIEPGQKIYIDHEEMADEVNPVHFQHHHHHPRQHSRGQGAEDGDDHDDIHDHEQHDHDRDFYPSSKQERSRRFNDNNINNTNNGTNNTNNKKTNLENRHRSLGPESIEILRLCGNIRCFLVAETPIEAYIHTIYQQQLQIADRNQRTFLQKVREALYEEGKKIIGGIFILLLMLAIVRLIIFRECRRDYFITILLPIANVLFVATPINLPVIRLLIQSFGIAEILSTLEVALSNADKSAGTLSGNNFPGNSSPNSKSSSMRIGSSTPNPGPFRRKDSSTIGSPGIKNPVHERVASDEIGARDEVLHEGMHEFVDDDLDERVDDRAEENAMKLDYWHYFYYVYQVLKARILVTKREETLLEINGKTQLNRSSFLPIPLSSINITEQLGAITMVCFVDDDIISENYSVTEEIFLLSENIENQEVNKARLSDKRSGKQTSADGHSSLPLSSKGNYTKGTVLDLHANPEATGSRFENPLWWKFLPCLKPLGLNALLTYKHTAENLVTSTTEGGLSASVGKSKGSFSLGSGVSFAPSPFSNSVSVAPSVGTAVGGTVYDGIGKGSSCSIIEIERSLVRHIRKTMPLEFLRELAEEIGFSNEDLNSFQQAIEVNVLAPGLQNEHLLEDNHVWGQDETRRRGSLLPTLRGGVYRDLRGGGLQMMSIGDPSLILNYCKEYWDGNTKSITPLSAADRAEVLSVFDRWRLEDFDVVAFSYSPMPVAPLLYFTSDQNSSLLTENNLSRRSLSSIYNLAQFGNANSAESVKSPTLFFVDPSKPHELMGGKVKRKSVINVNGNTATVNKVTETYSYDSMIDRLPAAVIKSKENPLATIIEEETSTRLGNKSGGNSSFNDLSQIKVEPRLSVSEKILTIAMKQLLQNAPPADNADEDTATVVSGGSNHHQHHHNTEHTPTDHDPNTLPLTFYNLQHMDQNEIINTEPTEEENPFFRSQTAPNYKPSVLTSNTINNTNINHNNHHNHTSNSANATEKINQDNQVTRDHAETQYEEVSESWDDSIHPSIVMQPGESISQKISKLKQRGLRRSLSDSNLAIKAMLGKYINNDPQDLLLRDDNLLSPSSPNSPMTFDHEKKFFPDNNYLFSSRSSNVGKASTASNRSDSRSRDDGDDNIETVHNILHVSDKGRFSPLAMQEEDLRFNRSNTSQKNSKKVENFQQVAMAVKQINKESEGISTLKSNSGGVGKYKYHVLSTDNEDLSIDLQSSFGPSTPVSLSFSKLQDLRGEDGAGRGGIAKVDTTESFGAVVPIDISVTSNLDAIINAAGMEDNPNDDLSALETTAPLMKSLSLNEGLEFMNPHSSTTSQRRSSHNKEQILLLQHLEEEKDVVNAKRLIQESLLPTRQRSKTFSPTSPEEIGFLLPNPIDLDAASSPIGNNDRTIAIPAFNRSSSTPCDESKTAGKMDLAGSSTLNSPSGLTRKRSSTNTSSKLIRNSKASNSATQLAERVAMLDPSRKGKSFHHLSEQFPSRQTVAQQHQQQQRNHSILKQRRREALRHLWSLMRQQIFLGMVASSVPVRHDVTQTKEDLDTAGIRFVYFSAQNMKRSKPVAEKIGIPFDWNCAISLRNLETSDKPDPHRHISNYADWDVLARMPHGIEAIRQHLIAVDNVPLLVSLFTDATPQTIQQMIEIFRENGETVLAIGSGYRCYNQNIYSAANLASSITVLPNVRSFLPGYERDMYDLYPVFANHSLTKADLKLSFDLVGLGTINLLQAKCFYHDIILHRTDWSQRFDETLIDHLKLPVLLETIRKGRVILLNKFQCLGFMILCILALTSWQCIAYAIPISVPPICPPPMLLVFVILYIPALMIVMLFTDDHDGIMKTTPRKTHLTRRWRDESRFYWYVIVRVVAILLNIWSTGYITTISLYRKNYSNDGDFYDSVKSFHTIFAESQSLSQQIQDLRIFWLIQDMMVHAAFLSILFQSASLLVRGQQLWKGFPLPQNYKAYYSMIVFLLIIHGLISLFRSLFRSCYFTGNGIELFSGIDCSNDAKNVETYEYTDLHYSVWIVLVVLTIWNGWIGFYLNKDDNHHYRRYLQFLRLEFDTRLGMHSPR